MKKLTIKQIHNEELNLLKYFISLCDSYHLKYFLIYGTMLGAVRHEGFIPWDDDIDVCMPRDDYCKLIELIKNEKVIESTYCFTGVELNNATNLFLKLINKNIEIKEKVEVDKYLWLDIFVLDGLPSKEERAKKYMRKMFIMEQLYNVKIIKFKNLLKGSKTLKRRIIKLITKPFMFFVNKDFLAKKILRNSQKYNYNDSKYVSTLLGLTPNKNFYEKRLFEELSNYNFEDIHVSSMKNYDEYLTITYGDYMKLPPEEKRYTHNFDAYYIDNDD